MNNIFKIKLLLDDDESVLISNWLREEMRKE